MLRAPEPVRAVQRANSTSSHALLHTPACGRLPELRCHEELCGARLLCAHLLDHGHAPQRTHRGRSRRSTGRQRGRHTMPHPHAGTGPRPAPIVRCLSSRPSRARPQEEQAASSRVARRSNVASVPGSTARSGSPAASAAALSTDAGTWTWRGEGGGMASLTHAHVWDSAPHVLRLTSASEEHATREAAAVPG